MTPSLPYTRHARDRSTARGIMPPVVELILTYGDSRNAGDGARKYALSGTSFRQIRRELGRDISRSLGKYRRVYVVASPDRIVTVAWRHQPLFH